MNTIRTLNDRGNTIAIVGVVIVAVVGVGLFAFAHSSKSSISGNKCTNKMIMTGSSGACVSDAQTLINWRAYGIDGGKYIPVTGTFDDATVSAVKLAQTNSRLTSNGMIDSATWKALCQLEDAPAKVVTAAKNAGC